MANYVENFSSKLDWAMPFQRTGKFPLDRTDLFSSYADAVKYAAGNTSDPDSRELCGTSYVGQIITVIENDVVTVYKIQSDRTLKEVGSATQGDGKSIDLGDGNILSLKNFGKKYYKYIPATNNSEATYELIDDGTFPAGLQPKTRLAEDGTIELAWYEPSSTTVEGLSEQMSSLSETVNTMQDTVSQTSQSLENKVDKVEGKGLSTNDFTTEEKDKLGGIESGAQKNIIEGISVNGQTQTPTSKVVDITVPTKVSDLINDSEFIDKTVSNLANYYLKSETYTKEQVNELVGAISTLDVLVVESLPTTNISTTTIYLVAKTDTDTNDVYDEYIYVASTKKWEMIGNTIIDLSNYLTKTGDASKVTVAFTEADTRTLPVSGEALDIILGKLVKYLNSLSAVAFSGSFADLTNKPQYHIEKSVASIIAGNTSVTIELGSNNVGNIVSVLAKDSVTGEMLIVDSEVSDTSLIASISSAYTNAINVVVSYLVANS